MEGTEQVCQLPRRWPGTGTGTGTNMETLAMDHRCASPLSTRVDETRMQPVGADVTMSGGRKKEPITCSGLRTDAAFQVSQRGISVAFTQQLEQLVCQGCLQ